MPSSRVCIEMSYSQHATQLLQPHNVQRTQKCHCCFTYFHNFHRITKRAVQRFALVAFPVFGDMFTKSPEKKGFWKLKHNFRTTSWLVVRVFKSMPFLVPVQHSSG